METTENKAITVEAEIEAPVNKVWEKWTGSKHITHWCHASDDWHAPYADNDLRVNGTFKTTMAAKDGSFSFDFEGVYTNVQTNSVIEYILGDGRKVKIVFAEQGDKTKVTETFDPETINPVELQKGGWQAILNNFKKYVETT